MTYSTQHNAKEGEKMMSINNTATISINYTTISIYLEIYFLFGFNAA